MKCFNEVKMNGLSGELLSIAVSFERSYEEENTSFIIYSLLRAEMTSYSEKSRPADTLNITLVPRLFDILCASVCVFFWPSKENYTHRSQKVK